MTDAPTPPPAADPAVSPASHDAVPDALADLAFHPGRRPELTDEQVVRIAADCGLTADMREAFGTSGLSPLGMKMGFRFLELTPERAVATMPVEGNEQPVGLLHGGAHLVLAETLGSVAATLHAGAGRAAVGIEISATHHRAIRAGTVTGTATAIHLGRSLTTHEVVMTDEQGRRLSTVRMTNMLLDRG